MRVVAIVAVVWITGLFITWAFMYGASPPAPEPDRPDEDLEKDVLAAAELALEDVYADLGPPSAARADLASGATLVRQVVRGVPGQRPRPAGLR